MVRAVSSSIIPGFWNVCEGKIQDPCPISPLTPTRKSLFLEELVSEYTISQSWCCPRTFIRCCSSRRYSPLVIPALAAYSSGTCTSSGTCNLALSFALWATVTGHDGFPQVRALSSLQRQQDFMRPYLKGTRETDFLDKANAWKHAS